MLNSIFRGKAIVSYIASTGSRKSLAFLLPPLCEEYRQTLVITPLVALCMDIASKLQQMCITSSCFNSPDFNKTARVILAMPEDISKQQFTMLVDRRRALGQLERIVLDKFHYVLLPDHEY